MVLVRYVMNALINCGHHTAKNEPHALFGFAMKSVDKIWRGHLRGSRFEANEPSYRKPTST